MPSKKKRIGAIAELFNSEKSYIQDLRLWQIGLRKKILGLPQISPQTKFNICDSIFVNISVIYRFHKKIYREMHLRNIEVLKKYPEEYEQYKRKMEKLGNERKERQTHKSPHRQEDSSSNGSGTDLAAILRKQAGNIVQPQYPSMVEDISMASSEIDDWEFELRKDGTMDTDSLEYATVFLNLFPGFEAYKEYVARLPKSEYEFDRSNTRSAEFNAVIRSFQKKYGVEHIGTKHFFYRPSGKLARYPLLLKAILKNETNEELAGLYRRIIQQFQTFTRKIDRIFRGSSAFFTMFLLSNLLRYSEDVKDKQFLGLIFSDVKLIKEGKIILKPSKDMPATYKQIYIFNRVIVFCRTVDNLFDEIDIKEPPIFLNGLTVIRRPTERFGRDEKLDALYPIYLMQQSLGIEKVLYFEDESTRDLYYAMIYRAIDRIKRKMRTEPSLQLGIRLADEKILCACTTGGVTMSLRKIPTQLDLRPPGLESQDGEDGTDEEPGYDSSGGSDEDGTDEEPGYDSSGGSDGESREKPSEDGASPGPPSREAERAAPNEEYIHQIQTYLKAYSDDESIHIEVASTSWEDYDKAAETEKALRTHGHVTADQGSRPDSTEQASSREDVFGEGGHWRCSNCFKRTSFYFSKIAFEKQPIITDEYYVRDQQTMLIYSTQRGIFRRIGEIVVLVSTRYATRLAYDMRAELLFYLSGSNVYVSRFNSRSMSLEDRRIEISANDFLYGSLDDQIYLTLISNRNFSFSVVYILNAADDGTSYTITLSRKLYVGFFVSCVSYMRNRIVIGCKDFEIVEVNTLRTQNLLEYSDPLTSTLSEFIKGSVAKQVFRIEESTYLLCFDRIGFYIDPTGCYKYSHITFNWECQAHSFRVYLNRIIVLSETHMSVFSLEDGKITYYLGCPCLHFVDNTTEPLIYDRYNIYRYHDGTEDTRGAQDAGVLTPAGGAEQASESGSTEMMISEILDIISSDEEICGIIRAVEKQKNNILLLDANVRRPRRDAISDDACLQHYSMRQTPKNKKKHVQGEPGPLRTSRSAAVPVGSSGCRAPDTSCKSAEPMGRHRKTRYRNSIALNKIPLRKGRGLQCKVNINREVRLEGLENSKGLEGVKNRGIAQGDDSLARKLSLFDPGMRGARDTPGRKSSSTLDRLVRSYDSVSTLDILSEYECDDFTLQLHN